MVGGKERQPRGNYNRFIENKCLGPNVAPFARYLDRPIMHRFRLFLVCVMCLTLGAGCTRQFETSYDDVVSRAAPFMWNVVDVQVDVPQKLSVSELNLYAPIADIVWQEEPLGDRHAQVARIFDEAARNGALGLDGHRPVVLHIKVKRFHAMTRKARYGLQRSGVHNISFTMVARDARSGMQLTHIDKIRADLVAFSGDQALAMEAKGQNQRYRIVRHLSGVISGWLNDGADVRGTFLRRGF